MLYIIYILPITVFHLIRIQIPFKVKLVRNFCVTISSL